MWILRIIVSVVMSFLWAWLVLWLGAKLMQIREGSWKNCAIVIGIQYLAGGVLAVVCLPAIFFQSPLTSFLAVAGIISAIIFLFWITMRVLNIGFGTCFLLCLLIWALDYAGSFAWGALANVAPSLGL